MERVPEEGPIEHIRNALQIVSGLSCVLESMREGGDYPEAPRLVRESAEGLEHRLSAALAQLTREDGTT